MAKKQKKYKRRLVVFGTISIIIIGYFFISLGTYLGNIKKLNDETVRLKQQLVDMKENEETLKVEIQKLKDPEYLARYARENYLYSKDGEYIINIKEKDKEQTIDEKNESAKYYIIGGAGFLGLLIAYVVNKSR